MDTQRILFGSDHESIHEAILADIVSGIPIIGGVTDLFRVTNAETKKQRVAQLIDTITEPIPVIGQISFTNTLLYLDKKDKINLDLFAGIARIGSVEK